ncbi:MAG: ERCC4 domain-containing protein, partial [Thermoplasmata archaeon]
PVGDYQIENAVLVERKSVEDFVNSIIDGRMFQQAKDLCNACACPIVIVEGKWNEYTRHISKSAIYGAVCSLAVDFGISVINFENSMEVAHFLFQTVRRISDAGRIPKIRFDRKPKTLAELQEYLVAGLPEVSTITTRRLLEHFRIPRRIFNASMEELTQVRGLGAVKAKEIFEVLNTEWRGKDECGNLQ